LAPGLALLFFEVDIELAAAAPGQALSWLGISDAGYFEAASEAP